MSQTTDKNLISTIVTATPNLKDICVKNVGSTTTTLEVSYKKGRSSLIEKPKLLTKEKFEKK